ncbi:hypothetical protein ACN469_41285 [Corallococcus terminator]
MPSPTTPPPPLVTATLLKCEDLKTHAGIKEMSPSTDFYLALNSAPIKGFPGRFVKRLMQSSEGNPIQVLVLANSQQVSEHRDSPHLAFKNICQGASDLPIDVTMSDYTYRDTEWTKELPNFRTRTVRLDHTQTGASSIAGTSFDLIVGKRILCDCENQAGCTGIGYETGPARDFLLFVINRLRNANSIAYLHGDTGHLRTCYLYAIQAIKAQCDDLKYVPDPNDSTNCVGFAFSKKNA